MIEAEFKSGFVPAGSVYATKAPVLVGGHGGDPDHPPVKIVPVVEAGEVRYIEVHCSCGNTTILECLYAKEES